MVPMKSDAPLRKVQNDEQQQLIDSLFTSAVHMRMLASHYSKRTKAIAGMGCMVTASSIFASVFSAATIELTAITIIASLMATMMSDVLHRRTIFDGKYEDRKTDKRINEWLNQSEDR